MQEKYIWPLVGVLLGWLLTLMATTLKDRGERRRRVGKLLSRLIEVKDQLATLVLASEHILDETENIAQYENTRKHIVDKHFLEHEYQIESLNAAIDDISGDYPFLSLDLQGLVRSLLKIKNASFSELSKVKNSYLRAIAMHEVTLDAFEKRIDDEIKRIAFFHGLITYIRVLFLLSKRRRLKSRKNILFKELSKFAFAEKKEIK